MKSLRLLLLTGLFFATLSAFSQDDSLPRKIISFVPQNLIKKGIRVDYDLRLTDRNWLQLCPRFYLGDKNFRDDYNGYSGYNYYSGTYYFNGINNEDYNFMVGAGLSVYYKSFARQQSQMGWYLSYGLSYDFFYTEFNVVENNNSLNSIGHSVNKIGGDVLFGYQNIFWDIISLDLYTGLGTRFATFSPSLSGIHKFDSFYTSYGYTGNLMQLGFRIGVVL